MIINFTQFYQFCNNFFRVESCALSLYQFLTGATAPLLTAFIGLWSFVHGLTDNQKVSTKLLKGCCFFS